MELKKGETFASLLNIHGGDIHVVPTHLDFVFFLLINCKCMVCLRRCIVVTIDGALYDVEVKDWKPLV
jgi:hypothetical protein